MKNILNRLINHEMLSATEAKDVLVNISNGSYNTSQIASFLTVYMMRSVSIEELSGFREALLDLCIRIDLSAYNTVDLCGTGGDGKDTFNISTLASFVAAGAGIKVAKHGNYGLSSISGSSNVMEKLGIKFSNEADFLERSIDKAGIAILHAPLFHPAMKNVGPIRKELAVKTFFNMLGPLVNPAEPKVQMSGVFSLELARMYHYILQNNNSKYSIIYGLDGFDEITLTDKVKIIQNDGERILDVSDFKLPKVNYDQLFGGNSVAEATEIFNTIINGNGTTSQNNVVLTNAALAIQTYHQNLDFQDAFDCAKVSLFDMKAKQSLTTLTSIR